MRPAFLLIIPKIYKGNIADVNTVFFLNPHFLSLQVEADLVAFFKWLR